VTERNSRCSLSPVDLCTRKHSAKRCEKGCPLSLSGEECRERALRLSPAHSQTHVSGPQSTLRVRGLLLRVGLPKSVLCFCVHFGMKTQSQHITIFMTQPVTQDFPMAAPGRAQRAMHRVASTPGYNCAQRAVTIVFLASLPLASAFYGAPGAVVRGARWCGSAAGAERSLSARFARAAAPMVPQGGMRPASPMALKSTHPKPIVSRCLALPRQECG